MVGRIWMAAVCALAFTGIVRRVTGNGLDGWISDRCFSCPGCAVVIGTAND